MKYNFFHGVIIQTSVRKVNGNVEFSVCYIDFFKVVLCDIVEFKGGICMRIFVIEQDKNLHLVKYLKEKYLVETNIQNLKKCSVVVISNIVNIKLALEIVDVALQQGIEVICIKSQNYKQCFVCNLLIYEGAMYV